MCTSIMNCVPLGGTSGAEVLCVSAPGILVGVDVGLFPVGTGGQMSLFLPVPRLQAMCHAAPRPTHPSPLTPADRLSSGVRPLPPGLGVSPTDLGETPSSACLPSCWGREYLLSCQGRGQAPPSLRVPALVCPCRLSARTGSYLPTWNVPAPHTLLPHLPSPPAGTHCLPPGLCLGGCCCRQWM